MAAQNNTIPLDEEAKKALCVLIAANFRIETIFRDILNHNDITSSLGIMAESGFLAVMAAQTAAASIDDRVNGLDTPTICIRKLLYEALTESDLRVMASGSMEES